MMMAKTKENQVTTTEGNGVQTLAMADFYQDSHLGKENIGQEDLAIPFLSLLQSGSPQCKKADGAYIKGAEEGMIFNSVTQEITPGEDGVLVIPCLYERTAIEWRPNRGGFVSAHRGAQRDEMKGKTVIENNKEGRLVHKLPGADGREGNELVETAQFYVMKLKSSGKNTNGKVKVDGWEPALISMSTTQLKKARRWNALISTIQVTTKDGKVFNPPMFSHIYCLSSAAEKNEKGSWWGWKVELVEMISEDDINLYNDCKMFHNSCAKGKVKVSEPISESGERDSSLF